METETITIETGSDRRVFDLTSAIEDFLRTRDVDSGLLNVFVPHATAGVAIIETGAGSDTDLMDAIDEILPRDDRWRHSHGSPGHGADHVLPAFVAPSVSVPVIDSAMALGTWQSVVLVDPNADNPRRRVRLSFLQG
ncbi:MAG: YjbQ family protein [Acidimicrobiia bacterium]|nr:YjbQ family protein [Acidimicrobiia bacterium]